jgi:hypothetical protein
VYNVFMDMDREECNARRKRIMRWIGKVERRRFYHPSMVCLTRSTIAQTRSSLFLSQVREILEKKHYNSHSSSSLYAFFCFFLAPPPCTLAALSLFCLNAFSTRYFSFFPSTLTLTFFSTNTEFLAATVGSSLFDTTARAGLGALGSPVPKAPPLPPFARAFALKAAWREEWVRASSPSSRGAGVGSSEPSRGVRTKQATKKPFVPSSGRHLRTESAMSTQSDSRQCSMRSKVEGELTYWRHHHIQRGLLVAPMLASRPRAVRVSIPYPGTPSLPIPEHHRQYRSCESGGGTHSNDDSFIFGSPDRTGRVDDPSSARESHGV